MAAESTTDPAVVGTPAGTATSTVTPAVTSTAAPATAPGDPVAPAPGPEVARRVDVALVERGLARSRTHAAKLVTAGRVRVGGTLARRASHPVTRSDEVEVEPGQQGVAAEVDWVSRGAVKLDTALAAFAASAPPGPVVAGRRCLDAGASTGGFTEVLLCRGARTVEAVDVGQDQLAAQLRDDPRVTDRAGTSVRGLTAAAVGGPVELLVADLSFISLCTVLPDLVGLVEPAGGLVVMVKPQFEVGRARLPRGGVVRDVADRAGAVRGVAAAARALGRPARAVTASELPGPAGNIEFFLWLAGDAARGVPVPVTDEQIDTAVRAAGP